MACTCYLLLMPILTCSSTLITKTKDDSHLLPRSRRSAQSFQTSFAESLGSQVRDAGPLLRGTPQNFQQRQDEFRRLRAQPSFSSDLLANSPSLFPEISLPADSKGRNPIRFPDPRDEDQLLLAVESFPEESLANRNDPVLTDFRKIEPKQKTKENLPKNDVRDNFERLLSFSSAKVAANQNSSPPGTAAITVTSKPITNPLLQKLFNRNTLPLINKKTFQSSEQPTFSSLRPQPRLLTQEDNFPSQIPKKQIPSENPAFKTQSLLEQIQNRINDVRRLNAQVQPPTTMPEENNKSSRSQASQLRQQILRQKQKQEEEISKILKADRTKLLKEKEIEDKQRQLEELLSEKKEKEMLLMEALVQQRAQKEKARRNKQEEIKRRESEEQERQKLLSEESGKLAREVESKRIADENRRNRFEEREKERVKILDFETSKENDTPQREAVDKAIDAVKRRTNEGSDKFSPAVWAAVKALTEFVESQDNTNNRPEVPQDILMAIIQLTDFLNRDIQLMKEMQVAEKENKPPSLSPNQKRLREQILKQKEQRAQEIANILNAETVESFMRTEQRTTTKASSIREKPSPREPFPSRILPAQASNPGDGNIGTTFNFDTLPVL